MAGFFLWLKTTSITRMLAMLCSRSLQLLKAHRLEETKPKETLHSLFLLCFLFFRPL